MRWARQVRWVRQVRQVRWVRWARQVQWVRQVRQVRGRLGDGMWNEEANQLAGVAEIG